MGIANLCVAIYLHKFVPVLQSYILEPVSIAGAIFLTYYNHTRTRSSSTLLLIYWPVYLLGLAIWVRTTLSSGSHISRVTLVLKTTTSGLGLLAFFLECIGPEQVPGKENNENAPSESPIITANIFSIWVCASWELFYSVNQHNFQFFEWMTPLMKKGASQFITENDLPSLRPADDSIRLSGCLERALKKQFVTNPLSFKGADTLVVRCGKPSSSLMAVHTVLPLA